MGWYQDNFPGSPAQRQRNILARGILVYTVLTGAAVYFFSPLFRRMRKEFDEGRVINEPAWLLDRLEQKKLSNRNILSSQPSAQQLLNAQQEREKKARGDFAGPLVSEETLRSSFHTRN